MVSHGFGGGLMGNGPLLLNYRPLMESTRKGSQLGDSMSSVLYQLVYLQAPVNSFSPKVIEKVLVKLWQTQIKQIEWNVGRAGGGGAGL